MVLVVKIVSSASKVYASVTIKLSLSLTLSLSLSLSFLLFCNVGEVLVYLSCFCLY